MDESGSGCFIGQLVLRNIIKELFEDVIERDKIDILRCVLTIRGGDILNHNILINAPKRAEQNIFHSILPVGISPPA